MSNEEQIIELLAQLVRIDDRIAKTVERQEAASLRLNAKYEAIRDEEDDYQRSRRAVREEIERQHLLSLETVNKQNDEWSKQNDEWSKITK